MNRRAVSFALALAVATPLALTGPQARPAAAAVAVLLSLDELVNASELVVVATAAEQRSAWEELGGGRRIVTYTRLAVERTVVGAPPPVVWVRTLGGAVGNLGQAVSGDAKLALGSRSLLYLAKSRAGGLVVTGMAQGHFPLVDDGAGGSTLASSPDVGALLRPPGPSVSAREALLGTSLESAALATQRARRPSDGPK